MVSRLDLPAQRSASTVYTLLPVCLSQAGIAVKSSTDQALFSKEAISGY